MNLVKRQYKNICIYTLLILYILAYRIIIFPKVLKYSEGITSAFSIILLTISIFLLGFRKLRINEYKRGFTRSVIIFLLLYFVGIYGAGLMVGFLKNSYSLRIPTLIQNILNVIIVIISMELFRYVFISANKDNKRSIVFATILLFVFEVNTFIRPGVFSEITSSFKFISVMVLPILMKHIMCTYLTYHAGYKPSLVYRLIMDLYFYVMPLQPDLNDYVVSILTLLLPFLIIMYSSRLIYENSNNKEHEFGTRIIKLVDLPFLFILVFLVLMVLDIGPYKLVGIETGSMTPNIKIGDAVVIDKNANRDKLKEKDIIAYLNKDNVLVVHRIITVNSDGTYITKGDYNNSPDVYPVTKEQIKGKVKFKIPFIAYPKIIFK